ncbi:hypothetical protein B7463_g1555, partial [Scytalidium lignicola]
MATQTSSASSALDEIRALLITKCEDPFDLDAYSCIGIAGKKSRPRLCGNPRGLQRRADAKYFKVYFSELKEYTRDDTFYNDTKTFLSALYCSKHLEQVMGNFKFWKQGLSPITLQEVVEPRPASSSDKASTSVIQSIEACPEKPDCLPPRDDQVKEPTKESTKETDDTDDSSILTMSSTETSTVSSPEDSTIYSSVTTPDSTFHELDDSLDNVYQEREDSPVLDPELESVLEELKKNSPRDMLEEVNRECNLIRRRSRIIHHVDKKFSTNDRKEGLVYALFHENGNVKVGWTTEQTVEQRLQHPHNCYASGTKVYYQSPERFVGAYRVETLVKADLRDMRVVGACDRCGRNHTEWFKADKDNVIKSIEDWTAFVRGVYDIDGGLNEVGQKTMEVICPARSAAVVEAYKQALAQHSIPEVREASPDAVILSPEDKKIQDVESPGKETIDHPSNKSEASSDVKPRSNLAKIRSKTMDKFKRFQAYLFDRVHTLSGKINSGEIPKVARGAVGRIFDLDVEVFTSAEEGTKKAGIKFIFRRS